MLAWLAAIDPNTVIGLLTIMGTFGTWLYHKVKGDKQDSFDDLLRGFGKQVIHLLLADPQISSQSSIDWLKQQASDLLWKLAGKVVPRNPMTEALATNLIEHVVGDALAQLRAQDQIPHQLAQVIQSGQATLATIEAVKLPFGGKPFEGTATLQPDGSLKRDDAPTTDLKVPKP